MMLIWHPSRRKAAQASPFNRSSHKILGQPMPRPQHLAVFLVCSAQVETPDPPKEESGRCGVIRRFGSYQTGHRRLLVRQTQRMSAGQIALEDQ